MQHLEVNCAVRPIYGSLDVKGLTLLRLIHTCHAAPMPCHVNSHMPFSDSAVSFVELRVVAGNILQFNGLVPLLITTFVELRVVAEKKPNAARSPTWCL
jgi:hypothetical protein